MHRRPLPPDLLRQASRRLEIICVLAACVWVLSAVLYHFVDRVFAGETEWRSPQSSDAIAGLGAAVSLAL